ncbi:MAG: hypothetical protein JXB15_13865 [Anaerolineales bacterium]|nr:hypothetical protein [Anaerolineales bacterium]
MKTRTKRYVSLQNRLALVLTLIFLIGIFFLANFLKTSADVIAYIGTSRAAVIKTRQLYQAKVYLQQFERAVNVYEINSDPDALDEYNSSYSRLHQYLANAVDEAATADERQALQQMSTDLESLRQNFDQVIAAVDAEDWETVVNLDNDAYVLVDLIFTRIGSLIDVRNAELGEMIDEIDTFSIFGYLAILVTLPVFLILVVLAALIIAKQIHAPLIRMADELEHIQESRFAPASLGKLPERRDEIGYLAREYLKMAEAVQNRSAHLQGEIEAIKAKIR